MLIDAIRNTINKAKRTTNNPMFVKDFTEKNKLIYELNNIKNNSTDDKINELIDRDIAFIKMGIYGEKNVYYELINSFLPIICLHDLHIKYDNYEAQIDFLIITNKFICILETKKLSGDILVNSNGDFIRRIKNNQGKIINQGMYSPVTQNERHVRIIKNLLIKNRMIKRCPIISMVVIANAKSIVNTKYAPNNIKKQLLKYDQLVNKIKYCINNYDDVNISRKKMMNIAEFLNNHHVEKVDHYILKKYNGNYNNKENYNNNFDKHTEINNEELINELKHFRLIRSKEENIKPYFIFNNKQMEMLIDRNPKDKIQLLEVPGFGKIKVEKYGDEILKILIKYNS